jgi:hypothetical protein
MAEGDPQNVKPPWEWHIKETYKGLITLSVELVKMLALVNGGAAIALLAYLGNFAAHAPPDQHPPHLTDALEWFGTGLFATVATVLFAYCTQLQLYSEERRRHEGKPFSIRHSWFLAGGLRLLLARSYPRLSQQSAPVWLHSFKARLRPAKNRLLLRVVEGKSDGLVASCSCFSFSTSLVSITEFKQEQPIGQSEDNCCRKISESR